MAGLFFVVFGRLFGRFKGAGIAVAGIAFYTLLVGAGPSVVRAALMGGLTLFAYQLGRRQVGLLSLILVAAVMVAFNPLILWNVGFQLSFAATLGLILYAQPLTRAFVNLTSRRLPPASVEWVTKPVSELVLFTVAAQLTTLPILIYYFQKLSLISLIANPLVLPAQPPVMILGGLALLLGMLYYPLGQLAAWLAWPFVGYTIRAVEFLAELQGSALDLGKVNWLVVVILYLLLFTLTFASPRVKQVASNVKPGLALAALGVVTVVVWRAALAAPDGRLHLIVLDTHNDLVSGDALLIQTPAGRSVLVNGGPSARQLSDALGRRLSPGVRRKPHIGHPKMCLRHALKLLLAGSNNSGTKQKLPLPA